MANKGWKDLSAGQKVSLINFVGPISYFVFGHRR